MTASGNTSGFYANQYGIGFGLVVLVYQFGYISGAQFNPCVLIGLLCRGSLEDFPQHDIQNICMYLLAQFSGAILAGFYSWGITSDEMCSEVFPSVGGGDIQSYQAFGAEFMFTFLLVFVIINVATSQQPNQFYGISIGWTVFVSIGCIGMISGCALNLAVWLGTLISASVCTDKLGDDMKNVTWKYAWIYICADCLGAMCAGFLYRFLFIDRHQRERVIVYIYFVHFISNFVYFFYP